MADTKQRQASPKNQKPGQKTSWNTEKVSKKSEEEALLRADTFTNAPKVSRRTLTK